MRFEKLTIGASKSISHQPRKKKIKPVKNIGIETMTKIRLSSTTPCLLIQVSFRPKPSKKTNIIKVAKGAI